MSGDSVNSCNAAVDLRNNLAKLIHLPELRLTVFGSFILQTVVSIVQPLESFNGLK